MRDPKIVLKHLSSLKKSQSVNNIYKSLYNPEFYKIAYNNIYSKSGHMTPASDDSTIDGMSEERIRKLIQSLRDGTYRPINLKRVNIPKKTCGTRPISIPSFNDKLVQEVIRMILEAIYEPTFSDCSHGFRPNRSCHTALKYIKNKFQGTKWWIDCDINKYFENINHVILLNILKERIREQKFIHLINLFLKTGYIENWKYNKTYSGVPQGSIIGPILSNIYLDKFDKFMEQKIQTFNSGTRRKMTPEYHRISNKLYKYKKMGINDRDEFQKLIKERNDLSRKGKTSIYDDTEYRRLSYVRYADDFVVGIISSKKEVESIKTDIENFLEENLKLEINKEKTKIIHNETTVRFLGYDISVYKSNTEKPKMNGLIHLWVPYEKLKNFILDNKYGVFKNKIKHKTYIKPTSKPEMINIDEYEILMQFNAKIRGIYNYYRMASNICKMNNFCYICQLSFLKTLATKYKTSCAKLYKNKNYCRNKKIGITYKNKFYEFFKGPFVVDKNIKYNKNIDIIENINKYFTRTSIIQRMEAKQCEFCGNVDGPFEIHHVRKLKDLKNKKAWEKLMIARKRKTIVLCKPCHVKLHTGIL